MTKKSAQQTDKVGLARNTLRAVVIGTPDDPEKISARELALLFFEAGRYTMSGFTSFHVKDCYRTWLLGLINSAPLTASATERRAVVISTQAQIEVVDSDMLTRARETGIALVTLMSDGPKSQLGGVPVFTKDEVRALVSL